MRRIRKHAEGMWTVGVRVRARDHRCSRECTNRTDTVSVIPGDELSSTGLANAKVCFVPLLGSAPGCGVRVRILLGKKAREWEKWQRGLCTFTRVWCDSIPVFLM